LKKQIRKIKIPEGKYCRGCKLNAWGLGGIQCALFDWELNCGGENYIYKCKPCLVMYPNGAIFLLKNEVNLLFNGGINVKI